MGDLDPFGPSFAIGLFDCWATQPMKTWKNNMDDIFKLFMEYVQSIFMAPWMLAKVQARLNGDTKVWIYAIAPMICMTLFVSLHIAEIAVDGLWSIAWFFYLGFATILTTTRVQCRERFNINGNAFEDFFSSLFFYPNVALQLDYTTKHLDEKKTPTGSTFKMEEATNGKVNNAFEK